MLVITLNISSINLVRQAVKPNVRFFLFWDVSLFSG